MTVSLETYSPALQLERLPAAQVDALYLHVPFCFHKCHYCDFYSITRQNDERMMRYVDLVLREATLWQDYGGERRPRTVFFGGGTPTLLPLGQMRRLIGGLRDRLDLGRVDEWTIEANPATVTSEYCHMLRSCGVNRLSFGAQSFNVSELKTLERHHDPADVPRSIDIARAAGFERLNLDLIYAIPGQSLESWCASLERAIGIGTAHLSCYGLTYEQNTPIAVKKRLGLLQPAEDSLEVEMLRHARRRLGEEGLVAYEISNYARPGDECRHNLVYWTGGNYIGLGPSAASHIEGHRWRNRPHLGEWEQAIEAGDPPAIELETLTPLQRAGELAMLLLRLSRGLNFDDFAGRSGYDALALWPRQIERFAKLGLIHHEPGGIRLSEAGLPVADAVAAEFLLPSA